MLLWRVIESMSILNAFIRFFYLCLGAFTFKLWLECLWEIPEHIALDTVESLLIFSLAEG